MRKAYLPINKQWTQNKSSFFLINPEIKTNSRSSLFIQIQPNIPSSKILQDHVLDQLLESTSFQQWDMYLLVESTPLVFLTCLLWRKMGYLFFYMSIRMLLGKYSLLSLVDSWMITLSLVVLETYHDLKLVEPLAYYKAHILQQNRHLFRCPWHWFP